MSDTNTCLNKHSDFSVQPKPTHYQACGNMASLKLHGDPNLKEEAVALLKNEEAAVEHLNNLVPFSLASLTKDIPFVESSQLHDNIEPQQVIPRADALSKPKELPSKHNVGQRDYFQQTMKSLFEETECYQKWIKMNRRYPELIGDRQLAMLTQHYSRQVAEDSSWVRGMTLHEYIWSICKQVHYLNEDKRNKIYMKMVGDSKYFSPDPTARNDPIFSKQDQKG